jgi:hypothetical protein
MQLRHTQIWVAVFALFALARGASAQWVSYPNPSTPHTKDGKPNLAAPAPRTREGKPDLSGIWHPEASAPAELISASGGSRTPPALGSEPPNKYFLNILADFEPGPGPLQPAALKAFSELTFVSRGYDCLPIGMPMVATDPGPLKIVQTPGLLMVLIEAETTFRQIFTDGRKLPADPQPSWLGSSVGRWEGDTLVVDTAGLNARTWLDAAGHRHSEQLRVTERFHRLTFGRMELQVTLDDPQTLTKPVSFKLNLLLLPDTDLIESYCAEDEKDLKHVKIQ